MYADMDQFLTGYPNPPIPRASSSLSWAPASAQTHLELQ